MKKLLALIPFALLMTACANSGSVSTLIQDATGIVTSVAATAADVNTVIQAVQQNNTGKSLNVNTIVQDVTKAATAINSSNLASTAQTIATAINQTIADAQAAGATPKAIINTVSSQAVAAQVAASAAANAPANSGATSYFQPRGWNVGLRIAKN